MLRSGLIAPALVAATIAAPRAEIHRPSSIRVIVAPVAPASMSANGSEPAAPPAIDQRSRRDTGLVQHADASTDLQRDALQQRPSEVRPIVGERRDGRSCRGGSGPRAHPVRRTRGRGGTTRRSRRAGTSRRASKRSCVADAQRPGEPRDGAAGAHQVHLQAPPVTAARAASPGIDARDRAPAPRSHR